VLWKYIWTKCIPVHYYNQKGAWMNRKISQNWLHMQFVPEVQAFLKERGLPQKAVLLLDNALLIQERAYCGNEDIYIIPL
jgi:hypothetical protein